MQKLSVRWKTIFGMICLITGFVLGAIPSSLFIFLHVSIYSLVFFIIGAAFLGNASYQIVKKN